MNPQELSITRSLSPPNIIVFSSLVLHQQLSESFVSSALHALRDFPDSVSGGCSKNDGSGLVLLSPSRYTPDPATQSLLQNLAQRAPANIKYLQGKACFSGSKEGNISCWEVIEGAAAKEKTDQGADVNLTSSILYQALR